MPRPRLTDEQREERRIDRNTKRREAYRLKRDKQLIESILARAPADTRTLIRGVFSARPLQTGLLRSKAEYIILMWKENMPKVGWQDEAMEVIAGAP
jgi:hypothetical protein